MKYLPDDDYAEEPDQNAIDPLISLATRQKHGRGRHTWDVYNIVLDQTRVLGRVL